MVSVEVSNSCKKELEKILKSGKNPKKEKEKFKKIVELLQTNLAKDVECHLLLPFEYRLHTLKGQFKNSWECHIAPDWVLVFSIDRENKILRLERTGTHSNLFNKIKR